jgi:hypothetical protein
MNPIDLDASHAAARLERSRTVHALLSRFAAWLRSAPASTPTIRAPQAKGRACFETGC